MYNEYDVRVYYPQISYNPKDEVERREKIAEAKKYKANKIKEKLWSNLLWRVSVKAMKKTGLVKPAKKIIKKIYKNK